VAGVRGDGSDTCRRYLVTVDGRKDPAAVPIVDELVALPLDLHVRERGFSKIVPNLMGI
jgi:formate dehydrogenase maturation protein FdhE